MNQDDERDQTVTMAEKDCHMLLVVCDATKGGFTKNEKEKLAKWRERMDDEHIFVICNKMDLVQPADGGANIPRTKAIQICHDSHPMFANFLTNDLGPGGRTAMVQKMTSLMTDMQLDELARPFKKADTSALQRDLEVEVQKLFPQMVRGEGGAENKFSEFIHFIDASEALRAQTAANACLVPPEFERLREVLFHRLQQDSR
jgi:hypothetical protein